MKNYYLVLVLLVPILLSATVIPAGDVSGVWDLAGSPYYIDGEIFLQPEEELTIEAGVDVIFNDLYKFTIFGQLTAAGTLEDPINFQPLDPNTGWHGLRFIDGNLSELPANTLSFCSFVGGFALGEGNDKLGGAIYCYNSANLIIENSYFFQNYAEWDGGAVYLEMGSDVLISKCEFIQNSCSFYGGGIITYSSAPVISDCLFQENSSSIFGAGFSCWNNSAPELYNCRFIDNTAGACTGLYSVSSTLIMADILFMDNVTDYGSGAACGLTSSSAEATNITAVNNVSPMSGGAFWLNGGTLNIYNSILWNNLPEEIYVNSGTATAANSCITDGFTGTNIITSDPQFIDYGGDDFHLTDSSPCIDTGDADLVSFTLPEYDLDGNNRVVDGDDDGTAALDMGAYEYFVPGPTTGFISGTVASLDGNLLENAAITAGSNTVYTSVDGEYEMEIEAGEYSVTCTLEGYIVPEPVSVTVEASETVLVDFILEAEVSTDNNELPAIVTGLGNHPNPFNPQTSISFQLNSNNWTTLEIYNLMGQKINTLIERDLTSGEHNILWEGKDMDSKPVPSGIYFYKLQVGEHSFTNKMILMK